MMSKNQNLLIVFHSQSGTTRRMADAVIDGARNAEVTAIDVCVADALEASVDDVLRADALLLGTPENFGYMSGAMKYFLDRIYYSCLNKVDGLPYALFVRAGNDGTGAVSSINRIVSGLSMRQVQEPVLVAGEFDEARLEDCRLLGTTMVAGLEAGIF